MHAELLCLRAHRALSLHGFSAAVAADGNQKQNRSISGCIC